MLKKTGKITLPPPFKAICMNRSIKANCDKDFQNTDNQTSKKIFLMIPYHLLLFSAPPPPLYLRYSRGSHFCLLIAHLVGHKVKVVSAEI